MELIMSFFSNEEQALLETSKTALLASKQQLEDYIEEHGVYFVKSSSEYHATQEKLATFRSVLATLELKIPECFRNFVNGDLSEEERLAYIGTLSWATFKEHTDAYTLLLDARRNANTIERDIPHIIIIQILQTLKRFAQDDLKEDLKAFETTDNSEALTEIMKPRPLLNNTFAILTPEEHEQLCLLTEELSQKQCALNHAFNERETSATAQATFSRLLHQLLTEVKTAKLALQPIQEKFTEEAHTQLLMDHIINSNPNLEEYATEEAFVSSTEDFIANIHYDIINRLFMLADLPEDHTAKNKTTEEAISNLLASSLSLLLKDVRNAQEHVVDAHTGAFVNT